MARKKELINPKKVCLQVETEEYNILSSRVPNVSDFFRECINNYINVENNLNDLKMELHNKILERDNLNLEIETLQNQIMTLENNLKENENNKNILNELIGIVKDVSMNEFNNNGITKDRIKAIANNKINPARLIKECKKHNIKIIKESQVTNSKIKKENTVNNNPMTSIIKLFNREFNSQNNQLKYNNDKIKFLNAKEINNKFNAICTNKGVSFNEFKAYILR